GRVQNPKVSDAEPDRTGHAGAADAAIALGVLRQILLMVVFSEVKGRRRQDLGGDRAAARAHQAVLVERLGGDSDFGLFGGVGIDARTVLRAVVIALTHALGRIVVFPENPQ